MRLSPPNPPTRKIIEKERDSVRILVISSRIVEISGKGWGRWVRSHTLDRSKGRRIKKKRVSVRIWVKNHGHVAKQDKTCLGAFGGLRQPSGAFGGLEDPYRIPSLEPPK